MPLDKRPYVWIAIQTD